MQPYNLPIQQKSSLSKGFHFIFAFSSTGFFILSVFMFFIGIELNETPAIFLGLFFLIFGLFFSYYYISAAFLKSFYLEMTKDYLKFFTGFRTHTIKWDEIYEAQIYSYNNNTALSVLLEKDRLRKTKKTLNNNLNSFFGAPPMSFSVPIRLFKDIDIDRLLLTMQNQINHHYKEASMEDTRITEYEEHFQNSLLKALSVSFLLSIIIGISYGFSIKLLNTNFLVIPLFGSAVIISMFNKYYVESSFNLFLRLFLGVLCLLQMFTGLITSVILSAKLHINTQNIWLVIQEYIKYFISSPDENIAIFIWGLMCLGMGIFRGAFAGKQRINNDYRR